MSVGTFDKGIARTALSVAALTTVVLLMASAAQNSGPTVLEPLNEKPLWRVDLHASGFAGDEEPRFTFFGIGNSYSVSSLDIRALAFSPKNEIAVAFVTREVRRGKTVGQTLHFASLDAEAGQVVAMKGGPARYGFLPLRATEKGNFLLQDNYRLILYSPKLERLNELDTELLKPRDGNVLNSFSADGRYIFVDAINDLNASHTVRTFNADTFQELRSRTLEAGEWAALPDYSARWQELKDAYRRSLDVHAEGNEWKEIYRDPGCGPPFYRFSADFLTDGLLAIQSCNKLTVTDTQGRVFFTDTFPPDRPLLTTLSTSSDGRRFAISLGEWKGVEDKFLDLGRHAVPWRLMTYDLQARAAIASFSIPRSYSFALSPDGRELALLRSGVLELFLLPAPTLKR